MKTYLLSDTAAPTKGPARLRLVYVEPCTGVARVAYEVGYAGSAYHRCNILRSHIRSARPTPAATIPPLPSGASAALWSFCWARNFNRRAADPNSDRSGADPANWRVYELAKNETIADAGLASIHLLNKPRGRPPLQDGPRGPSPLTFMRWACHENRRPGTLSLQDGVDLWPHDPRPSFTAPAADEEFARNHVFPLVLLEAMKHDDNAHPQPRAIAGLFLWWAGLHGMTDEGGMPRDVAVPVDMHGAFEAPVPSGLGAYDYHGNPKSRMRGWKKRAIKS